MWYMVHDQNDLLALTNNIFIYLVILLLTFFFIFQKKISKMWQLKNRKTDAKNIKIKRAEPRTYKLLQLLHWFDNGN